MALNGISELATKELRQIAKLELAAAKRNEDFDITKLPTQYSDNDVVDNPNTGGLQAHRPWAFNYNIVRDGLQLFLDPSDSDSYSGSGTSVYDLSSNEYTTTLVGSPTYSTTHFNFPNTTSRYIDTNQSLSSETFSIGCWFRTSANGIKMLISKETTVGNPWNYRIWLNDGQINFDMSQITSQSALSSPLTTYNNNTWYYVMGTRDDSNWYLYVNGTQVATKADTYTGSVVNSQEVWIGRSAFTMGYQWVGDIGQTFIYNRVLTESEVTQNFNATRSIYGV